MPRVAVIGAGPCGLTAVKNLLAASLTDITCYEATDAVGGNWVFRDGPGHSSVHEATHTISSKRLSAFGDFPMPRDYPDYPSHRQMHAYFGAYAERFGVLPHVRFRTTVERARRRPGGGWRIEATHGGRREEAEFDYLLVCSGHTWDPVMPALPGRFDGEVLHAHDFKRAASFAGRRVLVVGGGNSAADIAVTVSRVADAAAISMRRGYHILPKMMFGMPTDVAVWRMRRMPRFLRRVIAGGVARLVVGRRKYYGLEEPDSHVFEMHPTLSTELLEALRHGTVAPRRGISAIAGSSVTFADGRTEDYDAIICATGYRMSFPFLDEPFRAWEANEPPPLYLKMIPDRIDSLYFIGLFQPLGCIWNLADHQARIAALQIAGRLERPADIARRIERERTRRHWRFQPTPRHAAEVDYAEFRRELMRELAGARA